MEWVLIAAGLGIVGGVAYLYFWWDPYDEEDD